MTGTEGTFLCHQLARCESSHRLFGRAIILNEADADPGGTHGLRCAGAHAADDHGLAIAQELGETAVIVMMAMGLHGIVDGFAIGVMPLAPMVVIVVPMLSVRAQFAMPDGTTLEFKNKEALALAEMRGDGCPIHGGNGDLHGYDLLKGYSLQEE
jgi:hypothetical protein